MVVRHPEQDGVAALRGHLGHVARVDAVLGCQVRVAVARVEQWNGGGGAELTGRVDEGHLGHHAGLNDRGLAQLDLGIEDDRAGGGEADRVLVQVGPEPDGELLHGVPRQGGHQDGVAVELTGGGQPLQAVAPVHTDVLLLKH